ncbi:MAG: hypothetical protein ACXW1D_00630 [Halobacteriota archaeon]
MTKLATMGKRLSGVLAHEYAPEFGYCRKTVTVTVEAGMEVGAVLRLSAGKWVWVAAADVATLPADVAVLIETGKNVTTLAAGDHQLAIMFQGPAGVADAGLLYKGAALSAPQKATVQAALAAKGIVTRVAV